MARLDELHWLVTKGETWQSIATDCGCTRSELMAVNAVATGTAPKVGQIVHTPKAGAV